MLLCTSIYIYIYGIHNYMNSLRAQSNFFVYKEYLIFHIYGEMLFLNARCTFCSICTTPLETRNLPEKEFESIFIVIMNQDINENNQQGIREPSLPMQIIPDTHEEYIGPDSELTDDLPDDTEVIDLVHLKIRAMEDLKLYRFKKLVQLCLRQNLIESISEVDSLPVETMKDLDLYDNRIKHISKNINKLVNLENLDLSFNKIKHIKNLENLVNLENLYFVQNKISKIENLSTLKNLKNLELGGNEIKEIGPDSLKGLDNLQEIWLGKNAIPKLVNLHPLRNLRVLSIQSNRLTRIEGLEELENLEELYLSHNYLTKIEGLENNKKLTIIDITSNEITRVENMRHLIHLTDFWASFNKIDQSFESLGEELGGLPELDTIYLEGNPIQRKNETSYRRKLVMNLGPSLQKIDATYIRG